MAMRGSLILAGIGLVTAFSWMLHLFGGFLVLIGWRMLWSGGDVGALEDNRACLLMRGRAWISESHDGGRFLSRREGVWKGTPPLLALLIIQTTGLFLALNGIPAVLGVTSSAFIVSQQRHGYPGPEGAVLRRCRHRPPSPLSEAWPFASARPDRAEASRRGSPGGAELADAARRCRHHRRLHRPLAPS
jgi:hypothetical protein